MEIPGLLGRSAGVSTPKNVAELDDTVTTNEVQPKVKQNQGRVVALAAGRSLEVVQKSGEKIKNNEGISQPRSSPVRIGSNRREPERTLPVLDHG